MPTECYFVAIYLDKDLFVFRKILTPSEKKKEIKEVFFTF